MGTRMTADDWDIACCVWILIIFVSIFTVQQAPVLSVVCFVLGWFGFFSSCERYRRELTDELSMKKKGKRNAHR